MGGFDLFSAKVSETNWKAAENLGYPVNSPRDDIYFFAKENSSLLNSAIFSSDRGTGCCLETYKISKAPKKTQFGGVLRDCKDKAPVSNAAIVLKDGEGKTWTTTTDENGRYNFDLSASYYNLTLTINRELYNETTAVVKLDSINIDESGMLINKLVNTDLCIEKKLVIKPEDVVTLYFDFDKSVLKPAAVAKLDSIYNVLAAVPNATIQISGYTDGRGTVEYNAKLSDRRARACADYLISKGIDASRVSFVSFGACCPVEMELINGRDNADGRSKNRRALINVKKD
jgi:outer membrane protein OmpA-like peptidoglycan-associated protein